MTTTINGKEVKDDDTFMQVSIGVDFFGDPSVSLMLKNPAGLAKFELFCHTRPLPGGYLNKEKTIKLRDFLIETIRLIDEH